MATLKEKTTKGLLWGGMNNAVQQLVGVIFGIILGRILFTEDYGMMAMISIFSLIATTLQNSGFTTAIANLKAPTSAHYNAVFWFNIIMGASLYLLLFFCAPLIGDYYRNDKLVPLCRYAFLSIVIASFGTAQSAFLFKNMMAEQQAKAGMIAVLLSSITGVVMAYNGMAYWSLATQGLVYVLMNTLIVWYFSPWRPTWKNINFSPLRSMFKFSFKILATSITTHVNNNILNIVLGHYFSTHAVGIYNQAYQWNSKCFMLAQNMVNQVAQPMLVDLKDDESRQIFAFRKLMRFTSFVSFPLLLGFGMVAKEFILVSIKAKWLESAELIQILCFSGATIPLSTLLSNMIISKGKSNIYFYCTLGLGVVQIIIMSLLWVYGIRVMVIAYTLLNIAWLFVWFFFTNRLTNYSLWNFLKDVVPFGATALVMAVIAYCLTASLHNPWLLIVSRLAIACTLYVVALKLMHAQILNESIAFLRSKILKK
ncbi:MAG: lipopolysaccharide biosynthesis protein [Prevotella nanceiensis]|uniref:Lipopolysaccharide biosynthesis protein n=1 Tax=Hoylesella nanceiensis TaxID=425941 RepID=A0ABS6YAY8_9BACT|nr:lipopolysaccharide biosynthesis protein [Hoylesella nanceiensis]MBF1436885.1 lipopolysaccharide biosynthesis protein [Hoylesella nanceiensis]MBW4768731.1 lipopolysaccharide biosynthesis protein [Hoylesella nanceiensis]